jgi:hypothetical protein
MIRALQEQRGKGARSVNHAAPRMNVVLAALDLLAARPAPADRIFAPASQFVFNAHDEAVIPNRVHIPQ